MRLAVKKKLGYFPLPLPLDEIEDLLLKSASIVKRPGSSPLAGRKSQGVP
jgi:hypothetical protein